MSSRTELKQKLTFERYSFHFTFKSFFFPFFFVSSSFSECISWTKERESRDDSRLCISILFPTTSRKPRFYVDERWCNLVNRLVRWRIELLDCIFSIKSFYRKQFLYYVDDNFIIDQKFHSFFVKNGYIF